MMCRIIAQMIEQWMVPVIHSLLLNRYDTLGGNCVGDTGHSIWARGITDVPFEQLE